MRGRRTRDVLIRIASILFPLFALTAVGYFVGRRMKPDLSHANKLNMDVFVPPLKFNSCGNLGLPLAMLAFGEPALAMSLP